MVARKKDARVTLKDLGKLLHLTPRAVAQALNEERSTVRVSPATRKRVQAMAQKLNYRPNRLAQILRTGKSGMVGVLAFQAFGHLFQHKLYLARKYAEQYQLLPNIYIIPDATAESRDRAVDIMLDSKVDAVIAFNDLGKPQIRRINKAGVPIAVVGMADTPRIPRYYADLKRGFSLLARHLVERGNSRITLLLDTSHPWTVAQMESGVREVVDEAMRARKNVSSKTLIRKITFDGYMVAEAPHIHGIHAGGYLGMKELIVRQEIPDALICNGDDLALGALLACAEAGVKVPHDMRIAGFGDSPSSSVGLLPLTTMRQPLDELCRMAFADLNDMMTTGKPLGNREVVLSYELIVRASTHTHC